MAEKIKFEWQKAVRDSDLPTTTKTVLIIGLSLRMNEFGGDCFPSQEQIASDTSLSRKAVQNHLERAELKGWIERHVGAKKEGQNWRKTSYSARFPDGEGGERGSQPCEKGGESDSKGGERRSGKVANEVRTSTSMSTSRSTKEKGGERGSQPSKNGTESEESISVEDWTDQEILNTLRKGFVSEPLERELMNEAEERNLAI